MANHVQTTRALLEQILAPQTEATEKPVDRAHFCATHVEHATFGPGTCISEAHAEPDADGNIAWYTVQFADGARKIDTINLKVTEGKSHSHSKKPMKEAEETELTNEGAMSDLDADRKDRAYQTRQAKTTMKHISNPTAGEKKAAKDIKPGIAGYRDRVAMLKSAEARGALKKEDTEVQEANIKHPNQQKLDVHEPEKDELTAKDFEMLRKGKKAEKEDMKESAEKINVELVLEGTVNVQIPASPTFEHYLAAINYLVNDRTEDVQTEIIALANEAFENQEVDVLIRAQYQRDIAEASLKMPTATGMRVMGHRYGNSADAKRNQTKKSVDLMSGPSKKAMEKISKEKAKK